jgi:hypothetical protein
MFFILQTVWYPVYVDYVELYAQISAHWNKEHLDGNRLYTTAKWIS